MVDLTGFDPYRHVPTPGTESSFTPLIASIRKLEGVISDGWPVGLDNDLIFSPGEILSDLADFELQSGCSYSFFVGPPYLPPRLAVEYALYYLWQMKDYLSTQSLLEVARLVGTTPILETGRMVLAAPQIGSRVNFVHPDYRQKRLMRLLHLCASTNPFGGCPVLDALMIYVEFMVIHPLKDGNGRVARALFQYRLHRLIGLKFPIVPLGCLAARLRPYLFDTLLVWELDHRPGPFFDLLTTYLFSSHKEIAKRV